MLILFNLYKNNGSILTHDIDFYDKLVWNSFKDYMFL